MRHAKFYLFLVLLLFPATDGIAEGSWAGFYDQQTLLDGLRNMSPGVEENFREVILPALTTEERRTLGRVTLKFPLENGSHPANFFASPPDQPKVVFLPVSSLVFLRDLMLAYAWLHVTDHSIDPVTDYLAMLKYQWPDGLAGRRHRPQEVLGIPGDAMADQSVARKFQQMFCTAVVYIIGHELGHLYEQHSTSVPLDESRRQEEEADRFAMELMRRIGAAPIGMFQVFSTFGYLGRYASDPASFANKVIETHPLASARLLVVAAAIDTNVADFARTGTSMLVLRQEASGIRMFAQLFDDKGVQNLIRQKGLTANPDLLFPRKRGVAAVTAPFAPSQEHMSFAGNYRGKWLNTRGTDFDVEMSLNRQGDNVRGSYSFGVGNVTIEGMVAGNKLLYDWRWGTDYFGKGVLELDPAGQAIAGTWGYTHKEIGAGTWSLRRVD